MVLESSSCLPPGCLLRRVRKNRQRYPKPQKETSSGPWKDLLAYLREVIRMRQRDEGFSLESLALRATPWDLRKTTSVYLSPIPPPDKCGTRPFLKWVRSPSRSPHTSALPKIPSAPSAFPPPYGGKSLGNRPQRHGDLSSAEAHPARTVQR